VGELVRLPLQEPEAPAVGQGRLALPPLEADAGRRLVEAFLSRPKATTVRAYRGDLEDFRSFLGADSIEVALEFLLVQGPGKANELARHYKRHLEARGLSTKTNARRLSTLRSAVKTARELGLVFWELVIKAEKAAPYRDTRGPGEEAVRAILAKASKRKDAKGLRDYALLRLLFDRALRRGEVVSLDVEDLDLDQETAIGRGVVFLVGKGKSEKEPVSLPPQTRKAIAAWLEVRGLGPGPLFVNCDHAKKGRGGAYRLSGTSLARIVAKAGRAVGLENVRPHGLRHTAITLVLDKTGGDMRAGQRFSRHADLQTLRHYDDNREDLGGRASLLVASLV